MSKRENTDFRVGDLIVYPAHGVGRIISIREEELYGVRAEMIVITMEREGLRLMVPSARAVPAGLRPLVDRGLAERALGVIGGRPKGKAGTWPRRAQEYDRKIRSGDLLLAAEVVRDLRSGTGAGSYSERQIYERALERVVREVGPVLGRDPDLLRRELEPAFPQKAA